MSYFREKANDIEYFIEGISSVCNDKNIIARKTKERFGDNYSKLIDYLLFLETEQINAKTLATALNNRDLEDGFYRFESKCAKKNNLVIVTGYSDDLIELDGAIKQESNCFNGGCFHLERHDKKWLLKNGKGLNNISAIWYGQNKMTNDLKAISWSYQTNILHESFYVSFKNKLDLEITSLIKIYIACILPTPSKSYGRLLRLLSLAPGNSGFLLLLQSSAPMTRYGQELLHEPLVLVGTCYYDWEDEMCPYVLEKLCDNLSAENLLGDAKKSAGQSMTFTKASNARYRLNPTIPTTATQSSCALKILKPKSAEILDLKKPATFGPLPQKSSARQSRKG